MDIETKRALLEDGGEGTEGYRLDRIEKRIGRIERILIAQLAERRANGWRAS